MSEPVGIGKPLPRALVIMLLAAATSVATIGLRQLGWLIGPVFLALVIVILVNPLHRTLRRRGAPKIVALLLLLLAIYGILIGLIAILGYSVARLATIVPAYAANAALLLNELAARLAAIGIGQEQIREMLFGLDLSQVGRWLTSRLRSIIGFGANVIFLLSLLLFLGIESTGITQRMSTIVATHPRTAEALFDFAIKTRRFLAVTGVFAVVVGLADTILLLWLGIPLALLWGLLAALCNFIPYVGFIIGVIPPALLALLGGGWRLMIVVIVAYIVLNSLFTSLLPPYFVGDAVGLSITVTLISVVFWAWVLGPLGAVLAIPLTLLMKSVFVDADPRAVWAATLIGSSRSEARRSFRRTRSTKDQIP